MKRTDARRKPGVTVVLGVWNGARYLQQQLDSVAAQTRLPEAMVIADDGSIDTTLEIAERFAASAPFPVAIRRNPHLGIRHNFLDAVPEVRTEWIAWCDADDVWEADKLERCVRALETTGAVLAFHDVHLVDGDLRPLPDGSVTSWSADIRGDALLPRFGGRQWECFNGFATVFRTDLLDGVGVDGLPDAWAHDGAWYHDEAVHELARLTGDRAVIGRRLASYRQHGSSITGSDGRPSTVDRFRTAGDQYERRQRSAEEAVRWAGAVPGLADDHDVGRHLRRVARDQRHRAGVYRAGSRVLRARALVAGLLVGSYRRRVAGGHGLAGLAKDAVTVVRG